MAGCATCSTAFEHGVSGDAGATTAASTAAFVFCAFLQHFEQYPPVAAFPCKDYEEMRRIIQISTKFL